MRNEYLEPALFFALERCLIRIKLFDNGFFFTGGMEGSGAFEDDGDAKVPSAIFGCMVLWLFNLDAQDTARFDLFFEHRQMVLFEKLQEFVGVAPFGFVIILNDIGLISSSDKGNAGHYQINKQKYVNQGLKTKIR